MHTLALIASPAKAYNKLGHSDGVQLSPMLASSADSHAYSRSSWAKKPPSVKSITLKRRYLPTTNLLNVHQRLAAANKELAKHGYWATPRICDELLATASDFDTAEQAYEKIPTPNKPAALAYLQLCIQNLREHLQTTDKAMWQEEKFLLLHVRTPSKHGHDYYSRNQFLAILEEISKSLCDEFGEQTAPSIQK